jgi:hypothetical protein
MVCSFPTAVAPCPTEARDRAVVCERKFVAPAPAQELARQILAHHCLPDPGYPEGLIESIYFDTPQLSAFWEKANGDTFKRKIRVRWYPKTDQAVQSRRQAQSSTIQAFFEIKDRLGAARAKQHCGFPMAGELLQDAPLNAPELMRAIRRQAQAMGVVMGPVFMPTVAIRYHRSRYVCPVTGTRVSLDTGLVSDRSNTDLLPDGPARFSAQIVCEAKSPCHRNWPWSEALFRLGFRSCSFSKYGEFINARIHGGR